MTAKICETGTKNPSLEFACPECETPLVAQWDAAAGVEVSHVVDPASVDPASGEVSAQFNASRMVRNLTAKHRTIAAVITAVFGLLLALNLTSTEDSSSPNVEPSNAEGPGDASAQLLTEPGPANKPVIEMAKSTGAAEESQPPKEAAGSVFSTYQPVTRWCNHCTDNSLKVCNSQVNTKQTLFSDYRIW